MKYTSKHADIVELLWTYYSYKVHVFQPYKYIHTFKIQVMVSSLKELGGYQGVPECKNMKNAHPDLKQGYSNLAHILA